MVAERLRSCARVSRATKVIFRHRGHLPKPTVYAAIGRNPVGQIDGIMVLDSGRLHDMESAA